MMHRFDLLRNTESFTETISRLWQKTQDPVAHLVVDCRRPPSDPGLCHLAHLGRSLSESIGGPDSLWLWIRPLRSGGGGGGVNR